MLKLRVQCCVACLLLGSFARPVVAELIIFDTLPINNKANLTATAGQSFTTPSDLQGNIRLKTIEIGGPDNTGTNTLTYALQVREWNDAHNVFAPGAILGESAARLVDINTVGVFDFSSLDILLDPSKVYGFLFTDGSGNMVSPRIGLQGGNGGVGAANGTLFSAGVIPFSDGYDTAARITTEVPEPASLVLILAGSLFGGILLVRRRRQ